MRFTKSSGVAHLPDGVAEDFYSASPAALQACHLCLGRGPGQMVARVCIDKRSRCTCLAVAIICLSLVVSCGQAVAPGQSDQVSAARTATPTPSPGLTLGYSDCTAPTSPGVRTDQRGRDGLSMITPVGWTETSSTTSEIQIIQLTAPAYSGDAPTTMTVDSFIGIVPAGVTAHQGAQQEATRESAASSTFTAGPVTDCRVQSDDASFFSFTDATRTGYRVFLIHNQLFYDAVLVGNGGLSAQSVLDFKAILGSWTWKA